ncbi:HypC/HybG/HupF family hydrogenase formation chaperone [Candidatus Dependentiae bacterium]|nr:HypC/HybG/HupF family hydrogenase formation chaperone [Candidatus Dependentiae bacterium]
MCLAVPVLVVEKNDLDGKVNIGGVTRNIRFDLIDSVSVGDYVLIHAGYAIEVLSESEAEENLKELEKL